MKKVFLTLVGLFLAVPVLAVTEQVPVDRVIRSLKAYHNLVFVNISPSFSFNQGCTNPSGNSQLSINMSNDSGKNIYSAALAAASSNRKVGFGVEGCLSDRPLIYRIDVMFD